MKQSSIKLGATSSPEKARTTTRPHSVCGATESTKPATLVLAEAADSRADRRHFNEPHLKD